MIRAEIEKIQKELIPLTNEYETAISAYPIIEHLIEIKCMLAKSTDYGLPLIDRSLLRVACSPDTEFLLQAELRAIQNWLQFKEKQINLPDSRVEIFIGYVNQDD